MDGGQPHSDCIEIFSLKAFFQPLVRIDIRFLFRTPNLPMLRGFSSELGYAVSSFIVELFTKILTERHSERCDRVKISPLHYLLGCMGSLRRKCAVY